MTGHLKSLYLLIVLFLLVGSTSAAVLVVEGNYQGKNLFVKNPFSSTGVGFCAYEVRVNGELTTDEVNSSAFEIDFTALNLKEGEKVVVAIKHKDDCSPTVLNAEALKPKSTFTTVDINVSKDGVLTWTTTNEQGSLEFIVEQYRWNKWIRVGEVKGEGDSDSNTYNFKVSAHSGINKFRVKQTDYTGNPRYSKLATYRSPVPPVTLSEVIVKKSVDLSSETLYEIYDAYGAIVKRGYGKSIDVSDLEKGIYYLNYDNAMEKFQKK